MSNLAIRPDTPLSLQMDEAEIFPIMKASLYPGASDGSIRMVLGYCRATGLDPMMKPVHIVPMYDRASKQMRDVVMPGIGKYRIDAARTGQLAGITEPEFGPDVNIYGTVAPEWCRVTVKRLIAGRECEFTAKEYWIENYATAGRDSDAPNQMWRKRPRGQLAKCAEAQALRKGFPEATGNEPTAEEMEGRYEEIDASTGEITPVEGRKPTVAMPTRKPAQAPANTAPVATNSVASDGNVTDVEPKTSAPAIPAEPNNTAASVGEIAYILKKVQAKGVSIPEAREMAQLTPGENFEGLTKDEFIALKEALL